MKIVILDGSAANPGDITWGELERLGELTVYDHTRPDELVDRARDAEICITNKTVFSAEIIEQLPKLKYIGVLATGFNVVDLEACSERGITVTNVPEYSTFATAQMTVALLLELTNHAGLHSDSVRNGDWIRCEQFCYWKKPLTELWNKTAVIIGYGKIGKRVCKIMDALGMNIIAVPHTMPSAKCDGDVRFMTLKEALPLADIISIHCPLTSETREMICKDSIERCKDGVFLINAARGPVINENDVAEALKSGKIAGYAADVVCVEPMLPDNPLKDAPNTIITPHTAWAPKETRVRLIEAASDNLKAFISGSPINVVN